MSNSTKNIAVFFDRDDTLNIDPGYLSDPQKMKLFPEAYEAVRLVNEAGLLAIVVSNQSGIGRGLITPEQLQAVNQRMLDLLAAKNAHIDRLYHCPHHPHANCACRKPRTALVEQAAKELDIDLRHSFVIGDRQSDIDLGRNMGGTSVLVQVKPPQKRRLSVENKPDFIAQDVRQAAEWVLQQVSSLRSQ